MREMCLSTHPDKQLVNYVLDGIAYMGLEWNKLCYLQVYTSHKQPPTVVQNSLDIEVEKGRLLGPFDPWEYPQVQVSSLGVIPKKPTKKTTNCAGSWTYPAHPENASVNVGINKALCSLTYMKVDNVVQEVATRGQGKLIAKLDIESAFRNVPVHPQDHLLLVMLWQGALYRYNTPIWLAICTKIFDYIADATQYISPSRKESPISSTFWMTLSH